MFGIFWLAVILAFVVIRAVLRGIKEFFTPPTDYMLQWYYGRLLETGNVENFKRNCPLEKVPSWFCKEAMELEPIEKDYLLYCAMTSQGKNYDFPSRFSSDPFTNYEFDENYKIKCYHFNAIEL